MYILRDDAFTPMCKHIVLKTICSFKYSAEKTFIMGNILIQLKIFAMILGCCPHLAVELPMTSMETVFRGDKMHVPKCNGIFQSHTETFKYLNLSVCDIRC